MANKFSTPIKKSYKSKYDDYINESSNYRNEESRMVTSRSFTSQLQNECSQKKKLKIDKKETFKQEVKMKKSKSWDISNRAVTK